MRFTDCIEEYFLLRKNLYSYLYIYNNSNFKNREQLSSYFWNSSFIFSITKYEKTTNDLIQLLLKSDKSNIRQDYLINLYNSFISRLDSESKVEYILFKNKPITILQYFTLKDSEMKKVVLDAKTQRLSYDFSSVWSDYEREVFLLEKEIDERRNSFVHRTELADKHYITRCGFNKLKNQLLMKYIPNIRPMTTVSSDNAANNIDYISGMELKVTYPYFNYSLIIKSHTLFLLLFKNDLITKKDTEHFLKLLLEEFIIQFLVLNSKKRGIDNLYVLKTHTSRLIEYINEIQKDIKSPDLVYMIATSMKYLRVEKSLINQFIVNNETMLKKSTYGKLILYILGNNPLLVGHFKKYAEEYDSVVSDIYDNIIYEAIHSKKEFKDAFREIFKQRYDMEMHKINKMKNIYLL